MRERDENAYIRFFALWFAAGMTLGVLLLRFTTTANRKSNLPKPSPTALGSPATSSN